MSRSLGGSHSFFCFLLWHKCDMRVVKIKKRRLAINPVWCLWLHFLIIIPACPWVLIAFWILIFDVVRLLSIRPGFLFRSHPNTPLKDKWAPGICTRFYRPQLNYLNLFNLLNTGEKIKSCLWLDQLAWRGNTWTRRERIVKKALKGRLGCYS